MRNNRPFRPKNNDGKIEGMTVVVRNGDVTGALRKFKKKVQDAGIIQEFRERQHFEKPSLKRAKKKAAGIARWKKKQRDLAKDNGF